MTDAEKLREVVREGMTWRMTTEDGKRVPDVTCFLRAFVECLGITRETLHFTEYGRILKSDVAHAVAAIETLLEASEGE